MSATVSALLREGAERLREAGLEDARREARVLLAHACGLTATEMLTEPGRLVEPGAFRAAVVRRAAREPAALILGEQEFWSLRFAVSAGTLVPRSDSEAVVDAALGVMAPGPGRMLDLGTGTGCLLLAVLSERPDAWGLGLDLVPGAAALARQNARTLGLDGRAAFGVADWDAALGGAPGFDLVLSNPPYIRRGEIAGLMPEVAGWEPGSALDGGEDGLDAYRRIVAGLPRVLRAGGFAVLEAGAGQAAEVASLAEAAGLRAVGMRRDVSGIERACVFQRL